MARPGQLLQPEVTRASGDIQQAQAGRGSNVPPRSRVTAPYIPHCGGGLPARERGEASLKIRPLPEACPRAEPLKSPTAVGDVGGSPLAPLSRATYACHAGSSNASGNFGTGGDGEQTSEATRPGACTVGGAQAPPCACRSRRGRGALPGDRRTGPDRPGPRRARFPLDLRQRLLLPAPRLFARRTPRAQYPRDRPIPTTARRTRRRRGACSGARSSAISWRSASFAAMARRCGSC